MSKIAKPRWTQEERSLIAGMTTAEAMAALNDIGVVRSRNAVSKELNRKTPVKPQAWTVTLKDCVTQQDVKELLSYNDRTGTFTAIKKYARNVIVGREVGSRDGYGYLMITLLGRKYSAHRLAWLYVNGKWPSMHIDHINGIRDDNRISNLRDVPIAQNVQNKHKHSVGNTGYRGVAKKPNGKFAAQIRANGKFYHLGIFDKAEDAAVAYRNAQLKLHVEGAPA